MPIRVTPEVCVAGDESIIPAELLLEAPNGTGREQPSVSVDGGMENLNEAIDKLFDSDLLKRLLAQPEIPSANSLIESRRRVLKHP